MNLTWSPSAKLVVALTALVAAMMIWLSTWTGGHPIANSTVGMLAAMASGLPFAIAWIAAAFGLGWPLRLLLAQRLRHGFALQTALGVAAMLFLDASLGALGILQIAEPIFAWAVIGVGLALAAAQFFAARRCENRCELFDPIDPIFLAAFPAIAVLFVAATSAPGWLWSSEIGGYDALSYHLQLPKEWAQLGRIEPLEHNVYSFLPGYVEAAYYHLRLIAGDGYSFVYAAQLLHALIACATAFIVMRLVAELGGHRSSASFAAVLLIGTPWTVVVSSLAYNETFVVLFLAAGWLAFAQMPDEKNRVFRVAIAVGVLGGAACGAKLTSIGFVALPLAIIGVLTRRLSLHVRIQLFIGLCAGGAIVLTPYFLRNAMHSGNPVFPFVTDVFGSAHWSAEQVDIWARGHSFHGSLAERLASIWNQLIRFGLGSKPNGFDDVWLPQWSILFPLAVGGLIAAISNRTTRRIAIVLASVIAVQVVFWLFFTHLKSRFLIPAAIPLAGLVALGFESALRNGAARTGIYTIIGLLWCALPVWLYAHERGGAPSLVLGLDAIMHGSGLGNETRTAFADDSSIVFMNTMLPRDARVLLVGEAAPLYLDINFDYQTTWDGGPLSRAMNQSDQPEELFASLKEQGFTHLYVDAAMLAIWNDAGWNDPNLSPDRVVGAADAHARLIKAWGRSAAQRLYELE